MMIGAHYPALNNEQVSEIEIPLPPLKEQKSIIEAQYYLSKNNFEKAHDVIERNIAGTENAASFYALLSILYLSLRCKTYKVSWLNLLRLLNTCYCIPCSLPFLTDVSGIAFILCSSLKVHL